jgi:hypothetical protein
MPIVSRPLGLADGQERLAVVVVEAEGDDDELVTGLAGRAVTVPAAVRWGRSASRSSGAMCRIHVRQRCSKCGPRALAWKRRWLPCHRRPVSRVCSRLDQMGRITVWWKVTSGSAMRKRLSLNASGSRGDQVLRSLQRPSTTKALIASTAPPRAHSVKEEESIGVLMESRRRWRR